MQADACNRDPPSIDWAHICNVPLSGRIFAATGQGASACTTRTARHPFNSLPASRCEGPCGIARFPKVDFRFSPCVRRARLQRATLVGCRAGTFRGPRRTETPGRGPRIIFRRSSEVNGNTIEVCENCLCASPPINCSTASPPRGVLNKRRQNRAGCRLLAPNCQQQCDDILAPMVAGNRQRRFAAVRPRIDIRAVRE